MSVRTLGVALFGCQLRAEQLKRVMLKYIEAVDAGEPAPPIKKTMVLAISMAIMSGLNRHLVLSMYRRVKTEILDLFTGDGNLSLLASAGSKVRASEMPPRMSVYDLSVNSLEMLWREQIKDGDVSMQTPQTPLSDALIDIDSHFSGMGRLAVLLLKLLSKTIIIRELTNQLMIQFGDTLALEMCGASASAVRHLSLNVDADRVSVEPDAFSEQMGSSSPTPMAFPFDMDRYLFYLMNLLATSSEHPV